MNRDSASMRKHTSMRNGLPGLEKREPTEETKDQDNELKSTLNGEQTEVMKKIQNKLRMRKRSTNAHPAATADRFTHTPPDLSSTGNLSSKMLRDTENVRSSNNGYDSSIDVPGSILLLLESDDNICQQIALAGLDP